MAGVNAGAQVAATRGWHGKRRVLYLGMEIGGETDAALLQVLTFMWCTRRVVPSVVNVCACSLSPLLSPRRVVLSCEPEGSEQRARCTVDVQIDGKRPGGNVYRWEQIYHSSPS